MGDVWELSLKYAGLAREIVVREGVPGPVMPLVAALPAPVVIVLAVLLLLGVAWSLLKVGSREEAGQASLVEPALRKNAIAPSPRSTRPVR